MLFCFQKKASKGDIERVCEREGKQNKKGLGEGRGGRKEVMRFQLKDGYFI